ncbi:bifunctional folylpolyglutamate synthase/dihydrofolate synthase [Flavobacterium orientale]|uniref:Dihydrofolate synthase/folylpolyglutamate synthase n=1 Tax=Flavobacterium orientale TaxID=1756020 RepID=A0A916Y6L2_9FLAO|nr:folylpolyglutamate synthase/dihydrofolate synthase family protein [Flavobacterium orientale]GGD32446.1 tetrahydrofolate synthase [Flavobacterium orientale]
MTYKETTTWMFAQLPMYQNQGASAYKPNLDNTIALANYLNNPEKSIKCIHVAGTNGKGSTSSMLASILQESGYKVGLYTSPHLKDFRERIKINGVEITEEYVVDFITKNKSFFEKQQLSFFEMTVGLAFSYFKENKIDIAIIEVGMGGRLDSTNIITPLVSVITSIGLDHTQFLGNTLTSIATEKAGIIKEKIPVVIGSFSNETKIVFDKIAEEKNAPIYYATDVITKTYLSDLKGYYQESNQKTVLQTLKILTTVSEFKISENNIKKGLLNVVKNTGLKGRWQQIESNPKTICDTAHNKQGLEIVMKQIQDEKFDKLHFVLGFVNDKNLDEILPLFPKKAKYYFSKPNNLRALEISKLQEKANDFGLNSKVFNSITEAYENARQNAEKSDFIYVGGSTFVVAEIL